MSNTKHLTDLFKVCSVLPALLIMPAMGAEYTSGDIDSYAYSVKTGDSLLVTEGVSNAENGVFHNYGTLTINDGLVFADNNTGSPTEAGFGTVIHIRNNGETTNTIIGNNVVFSGGTALYEGSSSLQPGMGGAIFSWSDGPLDGVSVIEMGDNVVFRNNTAVDGSAIYTYGYNTLTIGDNLLMENNSATGGNGAFMVNGYDAIHGTDFINTVTIGKNATFQNNTAVYRAGAFYVGGDTNDKAIFGDGASFIKNSSSYGGAVAGFGVFEFGDVTFDSNFAFDAWNHVFKDVEGTEKSDYTNYVGNGGAVLNRGNMVINGTAKFLNNSAEGDGGAIYNGTDAVMQMGNATFTKNHANGFGGAIYNASAMILDDVTFVGNHADQVGGAMLLHNGSDTTISNALFDTNTAGWGGALYTTTGMKNLTITNTIFRNNSANGTGGAGIYKHATLTDVTFDNNKATDKNGMGGGAMSLGAEAHLVLNTNASESNVFTGNKSETFGGAISTRDFVNGNNTDAYLDIVNTKFAGNTAGKEGGAIDNYFYHSAKNADAVYLANSVFSGNSAANGGAVYNHGAESAAEAKSDAQKAQRASIEFDGVTFSGNSASVAGGAIYNETEAKVVLSGNNTFTGNAANGVANDIYNDGTLTIASGMTSIDGGINGAGALDIQSDATLNMNYASIEQGTINIDGTLMASLANANDTVDISGIMSGSGDIVLTAATTGTYDISVFNDFIADRDADDVISFGKTYNVSIADGMATLTAKSASDIASSTGITNSAAGVISTFATSSDAKIQQVSLAIQEALNNGNTELVEKELGKLNPDSKPVGQSVAASVQGQVLTVASGRMSSVGGGATGRAGGDVTSAGVWAQGLINKSKLNGQFDGHTRGFALGADTLIDDVYTIGAGYAYNNTDIDTKNGDTSVESNSVFAYAQYKPANWYINATMNYTMSEYTDETNVMGYALDNQYDADAFGIQAMYGYDFASGITPELGMRYLHVSQDAHQNAGGNMIAEMNTNFLSVVSGVNYAFNIESDTEVKFSPSLRAAMTYDVISENAIATVMVPGSSAYFVDVENLSRLGGEFGIGLTAEWRGLEMSLNYELDLHEDYTSQTGLLKFRYDF